MSDQYFHFTKLFFFFLGIFLQHCFAQKQRDLHMDVPNSPLDQLMFEYKQTIGVESRSSQLDICHRKVQTSVYSYVEQKRYLVS